MSHAFAYAKDNANYQTVQSYLGQIFILGSKSVSFSSRIVDFVNDYSIDLALGMYQGETKALIRLLIEPQARKEKIQ